MSDQPESDEILNNIPASVFTASSTQEDLEKAALLSMQNLMQTGIDHYNRPKDPNEIDLVPELRKELESAGIDNLEQIYDNNRHVQEAQNRVAHAQQYNLNRFLYEELTAIDMQESIDTRQSRYCLLYEVKPTEWLNVIKSQVIPSMVSSGHYTKKVDENEQSGS